MSASFVLRGGRVIDPANGIDRIADLVIGKDKILGNCMKDLLIFMLMMVLLRGVDVIVHFARRN